VDQCSRQELVSEEAFEELEEATKRGEIVKISEAHEFCRDRGIEYANPDGVGRPLRRRKVTKAGRSQHENADEEEQEAFKKTLPVR
jgi:hypothetical protein